MESWLKSLPVGALDKWLAFDSIEPIGEQWRQSAKILHAIWSGINFSAVANGAKDVKPFDEDDFMPSRYQRIKKRERVKLLMGDACKRAFNSLKAICLLKK